MGRGHPERTPDLAKLATILAVDLFHRGTREPVPLGDAGIDCVGATKKAGIVPGDKQSAVAPSQARIVSAATDQEDHQEESFHGRTLAPGQLALDTYPRKGNAGLEGTRTRSHPVFVALH